MAFEIYKPRSERMEKVPIISISKSSIVLNNVARQKIGRNKIELAYDRDTKTLRIKPAEEGGLEMRKTKVFGKGFFNYFGISKKGKYEARYDPGENALYATLH